MPVFRFTTISDRQVLKGVISVKNIKEVLFAAYSEAVDSKPPTELDNAFTAVLCGLDDQLYDAIVGTVTEVINEQMKMAYMAGFNAGTDICQVAYAKAS